MDLGLGLAAWEAAIAQLDPTPKRKQLAPEDAHALRNPATLAAHLWNGYQRRAHTDVIAESIRELHEQEFRRLIITCPPQVGKTITAVVWAAFWWLCLNPDARIIIISYNTPLAVKRGRAIRNLIRDYGARYGLVLDPGTKAAHDWALTGGGGVLSVGVGAGITGNPGDVLFIDDPHKNRQEAESPVMRGRVHEAYGPDILSRLAPSAPVVLVQTRWHEDDLAGRRIRSEGDLNKGGRWRVVRMPALCDDPANDPLGRAYGEPLPHPRIPAGHNHAERKHWEEKRSENSPYDWSALWQGDPKPVEGALVSWKMLEARRCYEFGTERPCAQPVRIGVAIDPSGGGRDVAGIIGGYLGEDQRLYLTHDRSKAMSSDAWGRAACELAAEIDADCFIIETNFGADQATFVLRTSWEALRRENPDRFSVFIPKVYEVRAKKNKWLRAEPIAQQWIEDKVRSAQYLPDVEAEWATWQPGPESPGRIDASVYLAYELLPVPVSGQAEVIDPLSMGNVDLIGRLSPGDMGLLR